MARVSSFHFPGALNSIWLRSASDMALQSAAFDILPHSMRVRAILPPLLLLSVPLWAQSPPADKTFNGGGKWTFRISEDKFTDALYGVFELVADRRITDGIGSDFPSFV